MICNFVGNKQNKKTALIRLLIIRIFPFLIFWLHQKNTFLNFINFNNIALKMSSVWYNKNHIKKSIDCQ